MYSNLLIMKGTDWEIILVAFVFMILFVSLIFVSTVSSKPPTESTTNVTEKKYCKTDEDCVNNSKEKGKRCLLIYPGDFVPFCGCLTSEDCKVGNCESNNKCS
jgi:hypothetical protein